MSDHTTVPRDLLVSVAQHSSSEEAVGRRQRTTMTTVPTSAGELQQLSSSSPARPTALRNMRKQICHVGLKIAMTFVPGAKDH